MSFLVRISVFSILAFAAACGPAMAWGQLRNFGIAQQSGTLILDVIEQGRIAVCTLSDDERYSDEDLSILVEASLTVWLSAVEDLLGREIALESDCDNQTVDLIVAVGAIGGARNSEGAVDIAGAGRVRRGTNYFTIVGFNTVDTNASSGRAEVFMSALDFLAGEPSRDRKIEYLLAVSKEAPAQFFGLNFDLMKLAFEPAAELLNLELDTAAAVGERLGIDSNPRDLYPVMIHEFGHAFGLCDMREIPYQDKCNPQWRTPLTRDSVMAFGGYTLRQDDIDGIRSLFERFLKRPFRDPRIFGDDNRQRTDRFDRSLVRIDRATGQPALGFFVGDCATVLTTGHVLLLDGEKMRDPSIVFTLQPLWGDDTVEVDWPASAYDTLVPATIQSSRAPENDFFILPLTRPAEGCEPFIADPTRAEQVIDSTGEFIVLSLGGHDSKGLVIAERARAQTSDSCEIFSRPFGSKFYRDTLTFITDCDLTRGNSGSPVIHEVGRRRFLLGMAIGSDRLRQDMRGDIAYRTPESRLIDDRHGPAYRGSEGNLIGANLFLRLNGPLLDALRAASRR